MADAVENQRCTRREIVHNATAICVEQHNPVMAGPAKLLPGDGQLFHNPVMEGLPTKQELVSADSHGACAEAWVASPALGQSGVGHFDLGH